MANTQKMITEVRGIAQMCAICITACNTSTDKLTPENTVTMILSSKYLSTARYRPSLMKMGIAHNGGTMKIHRCGLSLGSQ